MLVNGADVDAKNIYGVAALHKAALRGNVDVVKILIEKGADVDMNELVRMADESAKKLCRKG